MQQQYRYGWGRRTGGWTGQRPIGAGGEGYRALGRTPTPPAGGDPNRRPGWGGQRPNWEPRGNWASGPADQGDGGRRRRRRRRRSGSAEGGDADAE
jgi:hypothetical protein